MRRLSRGRKAWYYPSIMEALPDRCWLWLWPQRRESRAYPEGANDRSFVTPR